MKESNKTKLAQVVQEVLLSEQEALTQEIKELKDKIIIKDKNIKDLKDEVSKFQSIEYTYSKYKWFYYSHFWICPQCDWHGWFEDWHGWWEQCDMCIGNWEVKIDEIQNYFSNLIKNENRN